VAITDQTRKLLWGRAGNRCAICRQELTELPAGSSSQTIIGDEAHAVARSAGGARGGLDPPGGDLDGYPNLVLLCRNDHRLIDDQPEVYPVSRLVALKHDHERWVADVLEGAREADAARWPEGLGRLRRESIARCIERWQALRLPLDVAMELAEDRAVGARAELEQAAGQAVVVLVGDVGSGKSLAGERLHQADVDTALGDSTVPAPVWLRARDAGEGLERVVDESLRALGVERQGAAVRLVVDGLDEVGPAAAAVLLADVRRLVHARGGSRAVVTTRLLEAIGNDDERVPLLPLSEEDAVALIARLSGNEQFSLWPYAEPIKEAARRPLFAIALGRLLLDEPNYAPAAPAQLIDGMVRIAVGTAWHELRGVLIALALAALRRDGGPVRTAELVPAHRLEALLATRLVVEERGRLRFPLIVFAQWFAAEAVLGGEVEVGSVLDVPGDLELWRYPLAIAVTRASEAHAAQILRCIAERNAGFASIIVSETVQQYGSEGHIYAGTWREAGEALLDAERAWVRGIGPLAELVAPMRDGTLVPLGVRLDDSDRLSTAWYFGAQPREELFQLDPCFFPLTAPPGFGPARSATLPGGPAWSWRWTRDELAAGLKRVLAERRLVLAGTPLEYEAVWTVALRALGRSVHAPGPLDVRPLLAMDPAAHVYVSPFPTSFVPVAGLRALLERYADENGMLAPPWPGPDRATAGGWVWSDFSAERVRERAEAILTAGLQCYEHFAATLLASLAPRMRIAATLPAIARGTVTFSDRIDYEGAPLVRWHLEPLAPGEGASHAELVLGETQRAGALAEWDAQLKRARPEAARWIFAVESRGVLDIFGDAPAAQRMYTWLWDDLKVIGWVDGLAPGSWPREFVPPLV
jgi:hypothetical protein